MSIGFGFSTGIIAAVLSPIKSRGASGCLGFLDSCPSSTSSGSESVGSKNSLPSFPKTLELVSRALKGRDIAYQQGSNWLPNKWQIQLVQSSPAAMKNKTLVFLWKKALEEMTNRVPNVDLRFFATAIILQRTTGGDLSEILEKIGRLIRERFQIFGQIAALTGEGPTVRNCFAGAATSPFFSPC